MQLQIISLVTVQMYEFNLYIFRIFVLSVNCQSIELLGDLIADPRSPRTCLHATVDLERYAIGMTFKDTQGHYNCCY